MSDNARAADELCARGTLACFNEGDSLALEGGWANDTIYILAGKAQITITGFKVAERRAGQHIGEMALIDPTQPRSTTAIAIWNRL